MLSSIWYLIMSGGGLGFEAGIAEDGLGDDIGNSVSKLASASVLRSYKLV